MKSSLVCVDASLALKIVFQESDSSLARQLWGDWAARGVFLIAPALWIYEVTSVIRNRVHWGLLDADLEMPTLEVLWKLPVQMLDPSGLHRRAARWARHFNRPAAYDSHYLALAEMADCPCWTADARLFNTVRRELNWVSWLGNYAPAPPPPIV